MFPRLRSYKDSCSTFSYLSLWQGSEGGHVFSFVPVNRPDEPFPPGEAASCLPGGPTAYTHIRTRLLLLGPGQCVCCWLLQVHRPGAEPRDAPGISQMYMVTEDFTILVQKHISPADRCS